MWLFQDPYHTAFPDGLAVSGTPPEVELILLECFDILELRILHSPHEPAVPAPSKHDQLDPG